jgi:DNA-binding SARP family transcriptional activator/predicted ATPase
MTKRLDLTLFGNLDIRLDGVPVTDFKSSKSQALLCYLAVTGQPHTRPVLAGLLWGDMPEDKARMNLSQSLSTLRRYFGEHLITSRQMVTFNRDTNYWLDVEAFKTYAAEGSVETLEKAAQFYRGEFLDGFFVRNAPEFENWALIERARLRELALRTLQTLAVYHAERGETGWAAAIDYTTRLLTLEPWQEEAHRELMRLLALSGKRSAALVQYERCCQILIQELGVEPGEETIALYECIRDGKLAPSNSQLEITLRKMGKNAGQQVISKTILERSPLPTNLPSQPTNFVGREGELDTLYELIINRGTRLVTLVGPGGIGKTRLALEFVERQLESKILKTPGSGGPSNPFPDGIYFVSLESLRSSELILPAIAEAMSYRLDRGEIQLMDYLSSKRSLLVIDNFEHLLDGAEILSRILRSASEVYILVTSRERLRLHEEQVYSIHGLKFPEPELASSIVDYSAGKLFMQAARRQQPNFTLDDCEAKHLARICWLVEGMPLALELAATWTDMLPISDIAAEIQRNIDFLATEFRNLPSRHRSVRAVIDVSWEQLLPADQTLFSQLSIFQGGFTREAVISITSATRQSLNTLVGKSLLRYSKSQDRYYIHELLRMYGVEKVAEQTAEMEELNDRHSQYYCQWFADQVTPRTLKSIGQKTVLEAMTAELENARGAWTWALNNHRINRLMFRTTSLGMYYVWRGGFLEGERTFRSFISHLADVGELNDASSAFLRASALDWQAFFIYELGDRTKALDLLFESQDLLNSPLLAQMDTRGERAHNLVNIARADWSLSDDARFELVTQAQAWYRDGERPFGTPYALATSARLAILTGRLKEARQFLEESLEIYESIGNQLGRAVSLTGLGNLAFALNDYDKAEIYFLRSMEIAEEMQDLERLTIASMYQGAVYIFSGQFRRAQRVLGKCVAISTERGLRAYKATALYYLGFALLHLGDYDQALECGKEALPLAEQSYDEEIVSQSIMLPAAAALARGAYVDALQGFEEATKAQGSRRSARVVFGEDCGQVGLGTALLQLSRMDEAQTGFTTLLQLAIDTHRQDRLLYALVGIALLLAKKGDVEQAVELYSLAADYPFVSNSRWFSEVFGQPIEATYPNLNRVKIDEARALGEQRDLWGTADEILLEYSNA